jgi:hypothetical protein
LHDSLTCRFILENFPGNVKSNFVSFVYEGVNLGFPDNWGPGVDLFSEFKKARGDHSKDDAGGVVDIDSRTF